MKKLIFVLTLMANLMIVMGQQEPFGISYQAVARNEKGTELINKRLDVRFSILKGNVNGELVWQELHQVETNEYGLFTLIIGNGTKQSGTAPSFLNIPWNAATHYLRVEVDFGNNFVDMGTSQMLAVPYALYALHSGNSGVGSQQLTLNPSDKTLDLSNNGGSVKVSDITSLMQVDKDSTNEIQTITYEKDSKILKLNRNGGQVDFSSFTDGDSDPANELQNLSLADNVLSISKGNSVTLQQPSLFLEKSQLTLKVGNKPMGSYSIDTDSTNEIQHLTYSGNHIKLDKSGGSIYDADTSKTNELITASTFDGDKLHIIEAGADHQIDISALKNTPWVGFNCSYSSFGTLNMAANSEFSIPWVKDFDDSNNFSNNKFVVPCSGVYSFSITLLFSNASDNIDLNIYNSVSKIKSFQELGAKPFSTSFLLKLIIGDILEIKVANRSLSSAYNINQAVFSGYRVH